MRMFWAKFKRTLKDTAYWFVYDPIAQWVLVLSMCMLSYSLGYLMGRVDQLNLFTK